MPKKRSSNRRPTEAVNHEFYETAYRNRGFDFMIFFDGSDAIQ
jgi:hypothetical protein